jgi:hypothetical protein
MIKLILLAFLLVAASEAWLIPPPSASRLQLVRTHPAAVVALDMTSMESASDFSSAMPAKPPLQEQLLQSAKTYCESMRASLADEEPPPELADLEQLLEQDPSPRQLSTKLYELMIEQGLRYDKDPETGTLTVTEYDVPNNLDVPEVKEEFAYLYAYGMQLAARGLVDIDELKDIVQKRLIPRTGLTPEAFDEWLGY